MSRKESAQTKQLVRALQSIRIRCAGGDRNVDWLPIIDSIAKEAIANYKQQQSTTEVEPRMFTQGREEYRSDIKLGRRYRDEQTGVEGVATSVHFFQHACERVVLEFVHDGDLKEYSFDAPRVVDVDKPSEPVRQQGTGGPERSVGNKDLRPFRRG